MSPGFLYIIASPIGNLEDITIRAIRILQEEVKAVYCEDTRQTKKLLDHFNIMLPLRSLHAHSPQQRIDELIDRLLSGDTVAYFTDSGTPSISDPGSRIVGEARQRGIRVVPLPGPSALAAIVSVSGFPETDVIFAGFLSKKESRRKKELIKLKEFPGIIVLFESPYRIQKTLAAIAEVFIDSEVVIGREMTKYYEEFISGPIGDIINSIDTLKAKGEFTIAVHNKSGEKDREKC